MNVPPIQYTKTADGISIAYWSAGDGIPFVLMPPIPWSHIQLEWEDAGFRSWFERLASNKRLVSYDSRGSGLSQHKVDLSDWHTFELDVDAVADRLEFDRFVLVGISPSAPVAISYAATRPGRVSHVVLWCPPWRAEDWNNPTQEAMRALLQSDHHLFTETIAHAMVAGWGSGEQARSFAAIMRGAIEPDVLRDPASKLFQWEFDTIEFVGDIRCPVLILQRREAMVPTMDSVQALAASIPDCQLVVLEGGSFLPWVGDMDAVASAIDEFLGVEPRAPSPSAAAAVPAGRGAGLATILFTDVEGSTALTDRLGDDAARELLREHERITRSALASYGGSEVKALGDGFMASFRSATGALDCAIALQREFAERAVSAKDEALRIRIGLNAGEPVAEDGDLFGTAVNMAARIAAQANGGEVLVSDVVRQLVAGKGYLFNDRGDRALRGFEDPVRLYEVKWKE